MKLIKINTDHYVVVDDSEIKEGDYWINDHPNSYYIDIKAPVSSSRFAVNSNAVFSNPKKITHSTKPLETYFYEIGGGTKVFGKIQYLSLQEVKELIGEVDVEKKAEEIYLKYDNNQDLYGDSLDMQLSYKAGVVDGYNQALEDNKEKKYTEEDIRKAYDEGYSVRDAHGDRSDNMTSDEYVKSLQPKTEWEVEIVDGKLKLK